MKKAIDRTVALVGLVVSSPIVGAAALGVRVTMGHPIMFRQERAGKDGRPFGICKLRTMSDVRDPSGKLLPDEQRLTRVGRFLRASSIDELPQLWNVLRGDLSIVGPRPLLMDYLPLYSSEQRRRLDVLPGLTGWAQINGRNATTWEQRFAHDAWYVDHWSPGLDLRILWKTASLVLRGKGVMTEGDGAMPRFRGERTLR